MPTRTQGQELMNINQPVPCGNHTGVYTMKTRFFAVLALLSLLVGSVGFVSPSYAQFVHSDNNGDNQ
jgi:hypothetical protein